MATDLAQAAEPTLTQDSLRARELIRAAAQRAGGEAKLKAIASLHYSLEGDALNGLQGYDPVNAETALRIGDAVLTADLDFVAHRYRRRLLQTLPGDIRLDAVATFRDGRLTTAYPGGGHMTDEPATEAAAADGVVRFVPALILRRALEAMPSATSVGERVEDGRAVDVVDLSFDPATRVRLRLAADDKRLLSLEAVGTDPLIGDDTVAYVFEGERTVDGLAFPERVIVRRRGQAYTDFRVTEAEVNPVLAARLFDPPRLAPLTTATAVNALGGGAYEITGLNGGSFRVLFFDLGDGVAVFDAPDSRRRSQWVAGEIRKVLGDKPVRYLVLSHVHDDHVAGVGYYVDQGARIVTVRENAALVRRYAVADSKLRPDLPALGRMADFLFVDGDRLTLKGAGGPALEIFRLTDCPHAKDMLVGYVPSQRLLVEADLYVELAGYSGASAALSRWLARPGAPRVDWIVGTHLGRIPRAAFDAAGRSA